MIVDVDEAARRLERGEVVAYPTETVYALGADAASAVALERLRELKPREPARGLSVLIADAASFEKWAPGLPDAARRLARHFWPGPLTLVVTLPEGVLAGVATVHGVGFRCSPQPGAAALARAFGRPVVSTSCNRHGEAACRSAEEVRAAFGEDLPIAGGEPAGAREPSTVVAIDAAGTPTLLRDGPVPYVQVLEELTTDERR